MSRPPGSARRKKAPPPPTTEIEIERLDDAGLGIGRHQGREIVVSGALPGERVAVTIEREGRSRSVARLRRVLTPSHERVPSPCPSARACEGCPLVSMKYGAQLKFKEDRVRSALTPYPALKGVRVHPVLGAEHPLRYRTGARLAFVRERGRIRIGLYRRGIPEVAEIGDCPLHHPLINRIVSVVRDEVQRQEVYIYNPLNKRGLLRYLAVKVNAAQDRAMVTFVTAERNFREIIHLAKWLTKKVPEVVSVHQNINASEGSAFFGRETMKVLGLPDLLDQVGEVRQRLLPTSSADPGQEQTARLLSLVRSWGRLTSPETIVEFFCGNGVLSLHLAPDAARVIGIDPAEEAVRSARENARLNALGNCTFLAGDVAETAEELSSETPPGPLVVLNAPHTGCEARVLQSLDTLAPRAVIYVAADPRILARDLDALHRLGYRCEEVHPVDLHPQTPRIASVARLVAVKPHRRTS